MIGMNSWRL